MKTAGYGYDFVQLSIISSYIREIIIEPIKTFAVISRYKNDVLHQRWESFLTSYTGGLPDSIDLELFQKELWFKTFLLEVLKRNGLLSYGTGRELSERTVTLMNRLRENDMVKGIYLFGKLSFLQIQSAYQGWDIYFLLHKKKPRKNCWRSLPQAKHSWVSGRDRAFAISSKETIWALSLKIMAAETVLRDHLI